MPLLESLELYFELYNGPMPTSNNESCHQLFLPSVLAWIQPPPGCLLYFVLEDTLSTVYPSWIGSWRNTQSVTSNNRSWRRLRFPRGLYRHPPARTRHIFEHSPSFYLDIRTSMLRGTHAAFLRSFTSCDFPAITTFTFRSIDRAPRASRFSRNR